MKIGIWKHFFKILRFVFFGIETIKKENFIYLEYIQNTSYTGKCTKIVLWSFSLLFNFLHFKSFTCLFVLCPFPIIQEDLGGENAELLYHVVAW